MKELLAYVGAELKRPEEEISDGLVFLINSRIRPPKQVTKEDIFVRAMFLVSDEVNSYGGRFPLEELQNLAELVVDSPVMVGHTKEKLPIARNFKAEVVQRDGQNWVKVWFYWLRSSKDALSLKENIDHGIYKECSLGFVFEFPQCSICGQDMRRCEHVPFKSYQTEEGEKEAYFNYRNVVRVLETSLVYRGAVPNTSMSDELLLYQKGKPQAELGNASSASESKPERIYKEVVENALKRAAIADRVKLVGGVLEKGYSDHDLDMVCPPHLEGQVLAALPAGLKARVHFTREPSPGPSDALPLRFIPPTKAQKSSLNSNEIFHLEDLSALSGVFLVEPEYDGIRLQIHKREREVKIFTDDGREVQHGLARLAEEIVLNPLASFILDGVLVRYKGRSRLAYRDVASALSQALNLPSSKENGLCEDCHLRIKLFDLLHLDDEARTLLQLHQRKKLLETYFPNTALLQKSKYELVSPGDLISKVREISSSEGAVIRKADSTYFEETKWFKWKRHLELDVLVTEVEKNKGGSYNYNCAIGTKAKPVLIGTTYSSFLQAQRGEIIRVRIDQVTKLDDRFVWQAPKVLDKRPDRKEPDPPSVLERMVERSRSAVHRRPSAAIALEPSNRFVLQVHWWGNSRHHDLRFQKGQTAFGLTLYQLDPDELDRGRRFLCEWKEYHDARWMGFEGDIPPREDGAEGNPSRQHVAHMQIIDRGDYQLLDRQQDFSSLKIQGEKLNGIYLVRKIRLKGQEKWLFWKRSTD